MRTMILAVLAASVLSSCRSSSWVDLDSIEKLRTAFNADRGHVRLVLLLSPT